MSDKSTKMIINPLTWIIVCILFGLIAIVLIWRCIQPIRSFNVAMEGEYMDSLDNYVNNYNTSIQQVKSNPDNPDCQSDYAINCFLTKRYEQADKAFHKMDELLSQNKKSKKQQNEHYVLLMNFCRAQVSEISGDASKSCQYWTAANTTGLSLHKKGANYWPFTEFADRASGMSKGCK